MSSHQSANASTSTIWTNLSVVYVVWGSTYAAIALVVETMPPLMSAGLRFVTAGLLLGTFLKFRKFPYISRANN